jgi:hypothetical protein
MFNTAESVKTLRGYYKEKLSTVTLDQIYDELYGESDRAKIILVSTLLEDALIFRISQHLSFKPTDDELDYIFRFEGPLGTFSSRTELAYMFGFIDKTTREQLYIIREMRNACAHSKKKISFSTPELFNVSKRIFLAHGALELPSESPDGMRNAFIGESAGPAPRHGVAVSWSTAPAGGWSFFADNRRCGPNQPQAAAAIPMLMAPPETG